MQQLRIIIPWQCDADTRRAAEGLRVAKRLGLRARVEPRTQYARAAAIVVDWETVGDLYRVLAVLIAVNRSCLRAAAYPPLYQAGVRYEREPRGQEDFVSIPILFELGKGDCDDLGGARVAQLRNDGEHAQPLLKPTRIGFHVQVRRQGGRIEDPSRILGMGRQQ